MTKRASPEIQRRHPERRPKAVVERTPALSGSLQPSNHFPPPGPIETVQFKTQTEGNRHALHFLACAGPSFSRSSRPSPSRHPRRHPPHHARKTSAPSPATSPAPTPSAPPVKQKSVWSQPLPPTSTRTTRDSSANGTYVPISRAATPSPACRPALTISSWM